MREFSSPDDELVRREVIASAQPAVLRGLVRHWPIVEAGRQSPSGVLETLRRFDNGTPVDAIMTRPEVDGPDVEVGDLLRWKQRESPPAGHHAADVVPLIQVGRSRDRVAHPDSRQNRVVENREVILRGEARQAIPDQRALHGHRGCVRK